MSDFPQGRFVWYDLVTTDPEAAEKFYGSVIGWTITPFDTGGGKPYDMWTHGETPLGGVMELPEEARAAGAPPHWMAYVAVADAAASTARAQELGASVHVPPTDIPTVGTFSVIADPQGATIALFTPAEAPDGPGEMGPVGHFSWHELATDDWQAAWAFYEDLFGWKKFDAMDMGEAGTYQLFGGQFPIGGMFNRPKEMPVNCWLYYVHIADIDETVAKVKAAGGQVVNGPMEVPGGGKVAQCIDPQGGMFALHMEGPDQG